MATDADHLLWIDLETTGLSPAEDEILEIGMILTDDQLNPIAELELLVQPSTYGMARLAAKPYVQKMHTDNGLLRALSTAPRFGPDAPPEVTVASRQILGWIAGLGAQKGRVAICGSGVAKFDYQFLERLTPELTDFCTYFIPFDSGILRRSYRTSTGSTLTTVDEMKTHRGIDDIRCHLAEAQQFRNLYRMAALMLEQNPGIDLSDPNFDPAAVVASFRRPPALGATAPISEEDARGRLAHLNLAAADPARYEAIRCERGWIFYFRWGSGPVLMNARAWVVADDGPARILPTYETTEAAVGRKIAN